MCVQSMTFYDGNILAKEIGENICMIIKVTEIPSRFHDGKECLWFVAKK